MVFSSMSFVCVFLPITFIIYLLVPSIRAKNIILLLFSLLFYAYGEPVFVFVLMGSVLVNYVLARFIVKIPRFSKLFLVLGITTDLLLLGVFKYADFVISNVNYVLGLSIPVPAIALPLGISFFTFQILSYLIDVYRKPMLVEKNYARLLLYISFFPQLIAGPVVKYHDVSRFLSHRVCDTEEIYKGFRRFVIGLSKKVFLSNALGGIVDFVFMMETDKLSAPVAWLGAVCYTLQIYYDFSGYSDMAIGMGHIFGFSFQENFDKPYISCSIQEFWRRWHMSLSSWFKEYLYIPLGGSRCSKARTYINKLFVFFCTGLWHGASWNMVIWGMIHGVSIVLEDVFSIPGRLRKCKWIGQCYTFLIVMSAFVLFRAESLGQGFGVLKRMITGGLWNSSSAYVVAETITPYMIFMFVLSVILCFPVGALFKKYAGGWCSRHSSLCEVLTAGIVIILMIFCILNLAGTNYNPFIYFQF